MLHSSLPQIAATDSSQGGLFSDLFVDILNFGEPSSPLTMKTDLETVKSGGHEERCDAEKEEEEVNQHKVAFRTKSDIEILDDGYKWRKYGKKMVKSTPYPRNYYRCSHEGCSVKKRVQRDKKEPSDVITTYYGLHSHYPPPSPATVAGWSSSLKLSRN
ncbi:putative WRKY transcription factor 50 [Acorus calamus]|uniref:WRKY transcription factor 50 n=1 Tax=Acorus calamus TaxID=4465 RepID=A0AAV9DAZ0_ACOCL|nr:putative WRKY transcription factor 50 [Acorus calamus]